MTLGFLGLTLVDGDSPRWILLVSCTMIGAGMGTQMLSLLLAVQHGVDRSRLGIATSLNQFSRSIGAAIGVAAMGAILAREPGRRVAAGRGRGVRRQRARCSPAPVRAQFAAALHRVFLAGAVVSGAGLLAAFFLPAVSFSRGVPRRRASR